MPQDPMIARAQQTHTQLYGTQTAAYSAACPCCTGDAVWHAAATSTGDLARTTITYRIDCAACGDLAEIAYPTSPAAPLEEIA